MRFLCPQRVGRQAQLHAVDAWGVPMTYAAPLADMKFALLEIAGHPAEDDMLDPILAEAAKLAGQVLAPLNRSGDLEGSVLENGVVRSPKGFKEAYAAF